MTVTAASVMPPNEKVHFSCALCTKACGKDTAATTAASSAAITVDIKVRYAYTNVTHLSPHYKLLCGAYVIRLWCLSVISIGRYVVGCNQLAFVRSAVGICRYLVNFVGILSVCFKISCLLSVNSICR